jgi:Leucine-rich repeat (LRR) protein
LKAVVLLDCSDLSYNQLNGSIPAELGNCQALTSLDLSDNQLEGTVPAELGTLTNASLG